MKRISLLLITLIVLGNFAYAQSKIDSTIVKQTACPPNTVGTNEQFVEASKSGYARTIENAKKDGIKMEMPSDC